jgi:hypothetical protein
MNDKKDEKNAGDYKKDYDCDCGFCYFLYSNFYFCFYFCFFWEILT